MNKIDVKKVKWDSPQTDFPPNGGIDVDRVEWDEPMEMRSDDMVTMTDPIYGTPIPNIQPETVKKIAIGTGKRLVAPLERTGKGLAEIFAGQGIRPVRAGEPPGNIRKDENVTLRGVKDVATGTSDLGITALMPWLTAGAAAGSEALDIPDVSVSEQSASGIAEGVRKMIEGAKRTAKGEGTIVPRIGGPALGPLEMTAGAMETAIGAMTPTSKFLNLLTKAGPLTEESDVARAMMAPATEYFKPTTEEGQYAAEIGDFILPLGMEAGFRMRRRTPPGTGKRATPLPEAQGERTGGIAPTAESYIPQEFRKQMIKKLAKSGEDFMTTAGLDDAALEKLYTEKGLAKGAADEAPVNQGGDLNVRGTANQAQIELNEQVKNIAGKLRKKEALSAEENELYGQYRFVVERELKKPLSVETENVSTSLPEGERGARTEGGMTEIKLPTAEEILASMEGTSGKVVDLDVVKGTGGKKKYSDADVNDFPVLKFMVGTKIKPENTIDVKRGRMVTKGEYFDTPRVFVAKGNEEGITLARAAERWNEMLPEEAEHLTDSEFLEKLNDEAFRYENKAKGIKTGFEPVAKADRIVLSRLSVDEQQQYKKLAEPIAGMVAQKYGWGEEQLADAITGVMEGKGSELKKLPQRLLQDINEAIAAGGIGFKFGGMNEFVPLEKLMQENVYRVGEETPPPGPLGEGETRRTVAEPAAFAVAGAVPFVTGTGNEDVDRFLKLLGAGSVAAGMAKLRGGKESGKFGEMKKEKGAGKEIPSEKQQTPQPEGRKDMSYMTQEEYMNASTPQIINFVKKHIGEKAFNELVSKAAKDKTWDMPFERFDEEEIIARRIEAAVFDKAEEIIEANKPSSAPEGGAPAELKPTEKTAGKPTDDNILPMIAAGAGLGAAAYGLSGDEDGEGNVFSDVPTGIKDVPTMVAGILAAGVMGKMTPKVRGVFDAMQRHVRGMYEQGEIRGGQLGEALRTVAKEYVEKGDGRFLPVPEQRQILGAAGALNKKEMQKIAKREYKLQTEIMQFARKAEPKYEDLTEKGTGEATSPKRAIVEAGWITQGIWDDVKPKVIDEINSNKRYADLGEAGKKELLKAVEKHYEYQIQRSNEAIFNGEMGLGMTPEKGLPGEMPTGQLKDIGRVAVYGRDIYRNFKAFFGKDYERAKKMFLDPLDDAKAKNVAAETNMTDRLYNEVVKRFDIKEKSPESAAVQNYGEGAIYFAVDNGKVYVDRMTGNRLRRLFGVGKGWFENGEAYIDKLREAGVDVQAWGEQRVPNVKGRYQVWQIPYTEQLLRKEFGDARAGQLMSAEKKFREFYDTLLGRVNVTRAQIYPNNPDKVIRRRKDYFRHGKEIAEELGGVLNIFRTPELIDPQLSGVSPWTTPKSKWQSFAQERKGVISKADAVSGFVEYLPNATYAIYIDPHIQRLRGLAERLAEETGGEGTGMKNANNMIEFLRDYANNLSGKTHDLDRFMMKLTSRTVLRGVNWMNNRVKSNTILGNARSMVAQVFNMPQGIASAKQYSVPGLIDTMGDLIGDKKSDKSNFIRERLIDRKYRRFHVGMLEKTKDFTRWMMEEVDNQATRFIWNGQYRKAIGEGKMEADAIRKADNETRRLVAGRGIGEMPLIQTTKTMQLLAPFQLEVGNLLWVVKDFIDAKDVAGIASLAVANYLFNNAAEELTGDRVTLDPIQAFIEATQTYMEEDDQARALMMAGGRLSGEIFSNMPFGQTVAAGYPEYGKKDFLGSGIDLPTRKQLFGRKDPTRYGGGVLAMRGLWDPWYSVPPFGGGQLKKMVKGAQAVGEGGVERGNEWIDFDGIMDQVKAVLMGPHAVKEEE